MTLPETSAHQVSLARNRMHEMILESFLLVTKLSMATSRGKNAAGSIGEIQGETFGKISSLCGCPMQAACPEIMFLKNIQLV